MLLIMSVFASLTVGVLLSEFGARFWVKNFSQPYVWKPRLDLVMHPRRDVLPQLSPTTTLKANSLGIRGDELKPAETTYRIVAAGGSAVECFALDQGESWPEQVATLLKSSSVPASLERSAVQSLNIGKSGFTNETLCYLLPRLLPRIGKVDVVLIMTGMGAVNSWMRQGTPSVLPTDEEPWDDLHWHSEMKYGWLPQQTALVDLAHRSWYAWRSRRVVLDATGGSLKEGREARARVRDMRETTGDPAQWVTNFEVSLEAIVATARPWARHVILVRQPWFNKSEPRPEETALFWQGFVGSATPRERTDFYSHRVVCNLMSMMDAATERVGVRVGVPVIRPADVLELSSDTFYDHCHLTPRGATVVAQYVAQHIEAVEGGAHRVMAFASKEAAE